MRQSIAPVIQAIKDRIESLTPTTYPDLTFSAPRGNLGSADAENWVSDIARLTRDFIVFMTGMPEYDDAPCHIRQEITVSIVYRAELADDVRDVVISEDVILIRDRVTQYPRFWGGADSVYSAGGTMISAFEDDEGAQQTFVVSIPFVVVTH